MNFEGASVGLGAPQRARGQLLLSFRQSSGDTVLDRLRQQGCLKARFPRPARGDIPEAVLLNTAGGITGGDDLATEIRVGNSASAVVTTQASERLYRASSASPAARVRTNLTVDGSADLAWLPQSTILFDGCRVDRRLDVDLAASAGFLCVESLLFGRAAMGEVLDDVRFHDRVRIRIDGKVILQDTLRLTGHADELLARRAVAAGGRALATILMIAPRAETLVDPLRSLIGNGRLEQDEVEAGVTFWRGILLARLLSRDGAALRRTTIAALDLLRTGARLPRVWHS